MLRVFLKYGFKNKEFSKEKKVIQFYLLIKENL